MRLSAKKDVDAIGAAPDSIGQPSAFALSQESNSAPAAAKPPRSASEKAMDDILNS